MKRLFVFSIIFLFILGCAPGKVADDGVLPSRSDISKIDSCVSDSDCTCGGIDKLSGKCFLGNKEYYSKYVDTSKSCPDFCSGMTGNLVVKCIDNKCMQVLECLADADCEEGGCLNNRCVVKGVKPKGSECSANSDCKRDGCSGQLCRPSSAKPMVTTCEFLPEYDCLRMISCGCVNGLCAWNKDTEYEKCVSDAKANPLR